MLNAVAHIVGAVVRNGKGRDLELAQVERHAVFDDFYSLHRHLAAHAPVLFYAHVNLVSGIHRQPKLLAETAYCPHVIGVVVGDKNVFNSVK